MNNRTKKEAVLITGGVSVMGCSLPASFVFISFKAEKYEPS